MRTLLAICGSYKEKNKISEEIRKIVQELDESDNKISQAENLKIKTDVCIQVAKGVKLDYKDVGILLGNILDNAIEACKRMSKEDRYVASKEYVVY
mgnify:FL=1